MTHFRPALARTSKTVQRAAVLARATWGLWAVSGSPRVSEFTATIYLPFHAAFRCSWTLENWGGLTPLPSASPNPPTPTPPPPHRLYDQKILIWFSFQPQVSLFCGSKDLAWPLFASVFSSIQWSQFHLFHLHHNIVIKSFQGSMHESTVQHEALMKRETLLVFKHDTLTPRLISRDYECWEPLLPW